jgi:hypothetical protein
VVTVTLRKLLIGAAVVFGVAALVPSAIAADRPDDRADRTGVGALTVVASTFAPVGTADTVEARIRAGLDARGAVLASARPDDRAGELGVGAILLPTRPDDRSGQIGVGSIEPTPASGPVASTGTDWSDPFTVGAVAAVFALLGIAVLYGVEHRRGGGTGMHGTPGMPTTTH